MASQVAEGSSLKNVFPSYGLEIEAKFVTSKQTFDRIIADMESAPFTPALFERDVRTNVYYDTKKAFHLYKRGFEYRSRAKGAKIKFDLKTPESFGDENLGADENGIFRRREYSYISAKDKPKLGYFSKGDLSAELDGLEGKELVPWVQGHFQRKRFTYTPQGFPDSHLEVAFETGHYETMDGQQRSEPMYIIEVELKSGQYEALAKVVNDLQEKYGVQTCLKTKGEMGFEFIAPHLKENRLERFEQARNVRRGHYRLDSMRPK